MNMPIFVRASANEADVAAHFEMYPGFCAEAINDISMSRDMTRDDWLREFAAALDDRGEAALRAMVARLDAIDAASTEG